MLMGGLEDHVMVTNLPLTELQTDEMDGTIGRHMDIHILDGKKILRSWTLRFHN